MSRVRTSTLLLAMLTLPSVASVSAQESRFLRQPSVGPDAIAFVHASDIWIVGREGGAAVRLTSDDGAETDPSISKDGRWIAFTGEYAGNQDVYVVPSTGVPRGGFFDVDGEWAVEAEGVAPDIEVMNTPADVASGHDAQLEAAVEEALRLLQTQAIELKAEPPAPVRYRRPARRGGGGAPS